MDKQLLLMYIVAKLAIQFKDKLSSLKISFHLGKSDTTS
jgi:hypothetical protein